MKDFLKQELQVGDLVIYFIAHHRKMRVGRIAKITNCFVFIDRGHHLLDPFKQAGDQVIKHPNQKILDTPTPNN